MNFTVIFCCYVLLPYFASFVSPPQEAITCSADIFSRSNTKSNNHRSSNTYYKPDGTEEQDPKSTPFMEVATEKIYPKIRVESMENKYFNQKLDHFHYNKANTWRQRYLVNKKYYRGDGIFFIWIGTDKEITAENMQKGLFNSYCEKAFALCFGIETRGYGESLPHGNTNDENLKYLNSDQALADVAWFIYNYSSLDTGHELPAKFGWGAYGTFIQGTLAARMRIKYPHLVQYSIAISAPMIAQAEFGYYFERIDSALSSTGRRLRNTDPEFRKKILSAYRSYLSLIENQYYEDFNEIFKLCDGNIFESETDRKKNIAFMEFTFARTVALVESVLVYAPYDTKYIPVMDKTLDIMLGRKGKYSQMQNAIQQFAELVKWVSKTENSCLQMRYDVAVSKYKEETGIGKSPSLHYPLPQTLGDRLSLYLRCTEHGHFETIDYFFGTTIELSFYEGLCHDVFPVQYYPKGQLQRGVRRNNVFYGGPNTEVRQVYFVYGYNDPYLKLGYQYNGHGGTLERSEKIELLDYWSFHELNNSTIELYAYIRLHYWTTI